MLVKTQSMYAAAYDEHSAVNVQGFMGDLLARAKDLFVFNGYLIDHARRGDLLPWSLLLDGIFECDAKATTSGAEQFAPIQNLGVDGLTTKLHLPSGRLIVSCLADLGKSREPILRVEPGEYLVAFQRDGDVESSHWFAESESDYQPASQPDWQLRLVRSSGVAAGR